MILTRAEGKDFSNEPRADVNFIEDGIYPASFVKCTEEQGMYGPQIKWLFTLDEVNNIKVFVNVYTSTAWAPGSKLDGLLVVLGVDTTNNFDLSTFNTDNIQKGTKALLMVQKQQAKSGNTYLKVSKWLPYSINARGAEPLNFPQEHLIMPQQNIQQQSQQFVQPQYVQQPIRQQAFGTPQINPGNPNVGMNRVTNVSTTPSVKKIDFSSSL